MYVRNHALQWRWSFLSSLTLACCMTPNIIIMISVYCVCALHRCLSLSLAACIHITLHTHAYALHSHKCVPGHCSCDTKWRRKEKSKGLGIMCLCMRKEKEEISHEEVVKRSLTFCLFHILCIEHTMTYLAHSWIMLGAPALSCVLGLRLDNEWGRSQKVDILYVKYILSERIYGMGSCDEWTAVWRRWKMKKGLSEASVHFAKYKWHDGGAKIKSSYLSRRGANCISLAIRRAGSHLEFGDTAWNKNKMERTRGLDKWCQCIFSCTIYYKIRLLHSYTKTQATKYK